MNCCTHSWVITVACLQTSQWSCVSKKDLIVVEREWERPHSGQAWVKKTSWWSCVSEEDLTVVVCEWERPHGGRVWVRKTSWRSCVSEKRHQGGHVWVKRLHNGRVWLKKQCTWENDLKVLTHWPVNDPCHSESISYERSICVWVKTAVARHGWTSSELSRQ